MTDIEFEKFCEKLRVNTYYPSTPAPYFVLFDQILADDITREGKEHIKNFFEQEDKKDTDEIKRLQP